MLKIRKFKFPVLFKTDTPLDRSLRTLQLPVHLPKLTPNG